MNMNKVLNQDRREGIKVVFLVYLLIGIGIMIDIFIQHIPVIIKTIIALMIIVPIFIIVPVYFLVEGFNRPKTTKFQKIEAYLEIFFISFMFSLIAELTLVILYTKYGGLI